MNPLQLHNYHDKVLILLLKLQLPLQITNYVIHFFSTWDLDVFVCGCFKTFNKFTSIHVRSLVNFFNSIFGSFTFELETDVLLVDGRLFWSQLLLQVDDPLPKASRILTWCFILKWKAILLWNSSHIFYHFPHCFKFPPIINLCKHFFLQEFFCKIYIKYFCSLQSFLFFIIFYIVYITNQSIIWSNSLLNYSHLFISILQTFFKNYVINLLKTIWDVWKLNVEEARTTNDSF